MSEWREVNLGDIASVVSGHANITKSSYVQQGYVAYSAKGPDGFLPTYQHDEDGIIVSSVGSKAGKTWFARGKWSSIANTMIILSTEGMSDPRFIYYWTILRQQFPLRGSAQPFISREDARRVRISIPDIVEQRRIARVLGAFDDLIERDRQLAKSQERLASNWAESVGDSCLLRDLASRSNISVKQPSGIVDHFSLPAFDSGRQPERVDSSSIKSGKLELRDPVVLVSRLNPRIPRVWMAYPDSRTTAVASTEFVPLAPIPDVPVECIYAVTSSQRFADEMASHATGTTGSHQRVDKEALLRLEVPDVRALGGDARAALSVLVSTAHGLRQESAVLERTRDELLPLLMSGAVRVSEVEDSVP